MGNDTIYVRFDMHGGDLISENSLYVKSTYIKSTAADFRESDGN